MKLQPDAGLCHWECRMPFILERHPDARAVKELRDRHEAGLRLKGKDMPAHEL